MDVYGLVLTFMVPPLVGCLLAVISTTKIFQETTKTSRNYLKRVQGTKLFSVTSALRRFTMLRCYLAISFYKKLLLISLISTRMSRSKCLTYQWKLTKSKSISKRKTIRKSNHVRYHVPGWTSKDCRNCEQRRKSRRRNYYSSVKAVYPKILWRG